RPRSRAVRSDSGRSVIIPAWSAALRMVPVAEFFWNHWVALDIYPARPPGDSARTDHTLLSDRPSESSNMAGAGRTRPGHARAGGRKTRQAEDGPCLHRKGVHRCQRADPGCSALPDRPRQLWIPFLAAEHDTESFGNFRLDGDTSFRLALPTRDAFGVVHGKILGSAPRTKVPYRDSIDSRGWLLHSHDPTRPGLSIDDDMAVLDGIHAVGLGAVVLGAADDDAG